MSERPQPNFRRSEEIVLVGSKAIYDSQDDASRLIPQQWREFRRNHAGRGSDARFVGASPCAGDHKIHYSVGVSWKTVGARIGRAASA